MKCGLILAMVFMGILMGLTQVHAQKGPVETAIEGCKSDLEMYCKSVTPGEGRILACLYAYEDKLSGKCTFALYDAANQLERMVMALRYLATECKNDITSLCSDTTPGEGRILKCLEKNDAKVSIRCKQAAKDVGLK
jgi:hypothetical protein